MYKLKRSLVTTSLLAFGVTFEMVSKSDDKMREEVANWREGWGFTLGVLPDGPAVTMRKEGDHMRNLGLGIKNPDLAIMFKNVDAAFLIFTAQIGSPQGFAEHRAVLHGSVHEAMQVSRAMDLVSTYLFPGFLTARTFKRPPKLSGAQFLNKLRIMALLGPGLALAALRK